MRKVLIDLNRNLLELNRQFSHLLSAFYQTQIREMIDQMITRSCRLFIEVVSEMQQLRFQKATALILAFLDEADKLMKRISHFVKGMGTEQVSSVISQLLQAVKSQVIFIEQYMQSKYAF